MKKYEEILENRHNRSSTELVKVDVDDQALVKADSVQEALAIATNFVPQIQKKILSSEVGLPEAKREQWLKTIDEGLHDMAIVPKRRTMTEKKLAVLQTNRHPTASSKFHQAVLESSSHTGMLMSETLDYEKQKLNIEKKFYLYKKKMNKVQEKQSNGEDTFIAEKNLEIMRLDLTQDIINLKHSEQSLQNKREELMEWSEIKEELYAEAMSKKEIWSPDAIDGEAGLQEIPLILRHFQNFIILKQQNSEGGGDISSVLNIEGLALTAFQEGMKKNKLGLYLSSLSDEQIKILWLHLYGKNVVIKRMEAYIFFDLEDGNQLCYPIKYELWKELTALLKTQKIQEDIASVIK